MIKRLLDTNLVDIKNMTKDEKLKSIKMSEGRVMASEIITLAPPMLYDVSNIELAAAFGADILILNTYDVDNPKIYGIGEGDNLISKVKDMTGRLIAVNMEPVSSDVDMIEEKINISKGRQGKTENIEKLIKDNCDMVVLTGNPATGVTNEEIIKSIEKISEKYKDEIIICAGKMHSSGDISEVGESIFSVDMAERFIDAGCDIVLIPAPGTIPGFTMEECKKIIDFVHKKGKMVLTAIGTSQEGADTQTIRQIALMAKMAGADIHHIGDCGLCMGMATPENIMDYSIVIKGKRHTYRRMARSIK